MISSKKKLLEKCLELGISCNKSLSKEKIAELIQQKEKTSVITIEYNKEIKRIYHLADIHIRYIERHEEYKIIFEKLLENIRNDGDFSSSIMVISGDIFHNRDRFVSETLLLFNDFVKKITNLVNLFVIVGNHDCFNHSDRLDTVSGISSITNYNNFHLLKKSGIYNFSNITFGVSSLLDGMGIPLAPNVDTSVTKIALYHGIVSGSTLDNGNKIEDGISLSVFKDYDLVLLGDIHRRQFLNKEKTVAYPGSLIQQSYKEELHHGYLKWDVQTKKCEFIVLENDYSFMDIPVNQTLQLSSINFTKYSRIRLIINPLDTEQNVNEKIEEIEKYTNVISIKKCMKEMNIKDGNKEILQEPVDLQESSIIKSFVEEDKFEEIMEIHQELLKSVDGEEIFSKSLPWVIEKIEFRNIFSYGGDILNTIDMKKGVTGILADNASGKTNILNTILYGLFGNSRTQNHLNKNIISRHSKKEDLLVRLTITRSDKKKFYIERTAKTKTRSRIKSSEAGQLDLVETLKFYTDDEILNLSSKPETEKLLKDTLSIIGKDEFVLTNMMSNISYGSTMSIISMTGNQFDEIFNNIFNLNKYVSLHKNSKIIAKDLLDKIKDNQVRCEMLKSNIKSYHIEELQARIPILELETRKGSEEVEALSNNIIDIDNKLLISKATGSTKTKEILQNEIMECDDIIKEYNGDINLLVTKEDEISSEYSILKKGYNKELVSGPDPCYKIKHTLEELENILIKEESLKKKIEFDADITNEYIKAKKYMKSINTENTLDLKNLADEINTLVWEEERKSYLLPKDKKDKILSDLTKTYIDPGMLLKCKKIIEDKESRDKIISDNIKIDQNINKLKKMKNERKIQDAYSLKKKLLKLDELLDYIEAYYDKKEAIEELKIIENNLYVNDLLKEKNKCVVKLNTLRDLVKTKELELYTFKKDIDKCMELTKQVNKLLPELEDKRKKLELYKIYMDVTHQKNLPKKVISSVIKNITNDANSLIYNTTGLLCEIQENDKWEVVVKKGDLTLGPEHCSGYERFILNTALKISFDKYKQLSIIKLFMIDETIDCVSESNLDQIDILLEYLQNHYNNVILISHNEDLKKKINNRIEIKIEKKNSMIC
jgi:DNA repair exonuclease SbcCD ATPase subunit/DNA repair exonuclease SbcCD nuclease subunit